MARSIVAMMTAWLVAGCALDLSGLSSDRDGLDGAPPASDGGALDGGDVDAPPADDAGRAADAATEPDGGTDGGAVGADGGRDAGPSCVSTVETCDGTDEDCDGAIDEGGACAGCTRATRRASVYLICGGSFELDAARTHCTDRGYDLVVIDTMAEQTFIQGQALVLGGDMWIGLTDRATEGTYVWIDGRTAWVGGPMGTGFGFTHWRPGEPNARLSDHDCVELDAGDNGYWNDVPCTGSPKPVICEL